MACPVCKKPTDEDYRPFCSRRCADIDLGHWFNEDYRIPSDETLESEPDDPANDGGRSANRAEGRPRGALAH